MPVTAGPTPQPDGSSSRIGPRVRGAVTALLTMLIAAAAALVAQSAAHATEGATQRVTFGGTSVTVPASWPVVDLTADPTSCVRFDQHAVYLGTPGADQDCPTHLVGHAAAVLLEPAGSATPTGVVDEPHLHQFERVTGGVRVVAAYGVDRDVAEGIIAGAASSAGATPRSAAPSVTPRAQAVATVPASATRYTGKGFDPCTAPSASTMDTWLADSPYRAIGLYIGGENRTCSVQPNLTAGWVSAQAAAGWHFFPLYVGKQAPTSHCGCSPISSPATDGANDANDAVSQAAALGFGPGTPIVFDVEAYTSSSTTTVLRFLSTWTDELHTKGYLSGVYGSSSSAIKDLADNYTGYTMPDIIDDAWWNGKVDTADPNVSDGKWANHQRIHQYTGGHHETYGGVTINIDSDYLDVGASTPDVNVTGRQLADLNGDGRPELVGRTAAGALLAYPHLDTSAIAGSSWGATIQIGSGWNIYDQVMFADVDRDGLPEIIARKPSTGALIVYPHLHGVTAIAGSSWGTPVQVGSGWNIYDKITLGDLDKDGLPEIIARKPSTDGGALIAYPHVAGVTTIAGSSWTTPIQIGSGWNIYSMITVSDLNADGLPELVAINASSGALVAYPHAAGVTAIAGSSWTTPIQIGSGWDQFDAFATADLNGDGLPELVVRQPSTGNGALLAYPHAAGVTTIAGSSWTTPIQIGSGWNIYT